MGSVIGLLLHAQGSDDASLPNHFAAIDVPSERRVNARTSCLSKREVNLDMLATDRPIEHGISSNLDHDRPSSFEHFTSRRTRAIAEWPTATR